jgi:hypothetical protein
VLCARDSVRSNQANLTPPQNVEPVCGCGQPENPDKTLVGCSNELCKKWLHDECLIHDALMKTYERLGKAKPHKVIAEPLKKEKDDEDAAKNPPLSPKEMGADETQATIDVKSDDVVHDNVQVKVSDDDESSQPARDTSELEDKPSPETKPAAAAAQETTPTLRSSAATTTTTTTTTATTPSRRRRSGKTMPGTNGYTPKEKAQKPYLGLFKASLKMDASPPEIEIEDLRDIDGGERKWTELVQCLLCKSQIV